MTRWLASSVVALLVLSASPFAQADVAGSWELTINGPQGVVNAGITLKQEGDKLTGTISSPQGEADLAGSVKESTVSLNFNMNTPQGSLPITITGQVDGSSMKGVLDFGMGTADFTGTKK